MDSVGVRLSDNSVVTSPVVTEGVAFTVASFVVAIKTVVADELTLDDEDEVIKGSAMHCLVKICLTNLQDQGKVRLLSRVLRSR